MAGASTSRARGRWVPLCALTCRLRLEHHADLEQIDGRQHVATERIGDAGDARIDRRARWKRSRLRGGDGDLHAGIDAQADAGSPRPQEPDSRIDERRVDRHGLVGGADAGHDYVRVAAEVLAASPEADEEGV